ncbi:ComEC/Rec2 family competence protein [Candidatus Saccharibacteria bacterium]|nr:ComEC/Rec2 family competence protein [Candidatus Saccharibacteria bacterium]
MKKLLRKYLHPSWAFAVFSLGVLAGDILIHIFRYDFFAPVLWLFVSIGLLIFAIKFPRPATLPFALVAGIILISFRAAPDFLGAKTIEENLIGKTVTLTAKVLKDPTIDEEKIGLTLGEIEIAMPAAEPAEPAENSAGLAVAGKFYASLGKSPGTDLKRSDRITLSGELKPGFGTYAGFFYRPKILAREAGGDFFLNLRDGFAEKIKAVLPEKEAGLALGYLLGIKSGVDKDFEDTLRIVGLTHIIVASGTHLSILASFARKLLGKFSRFSGFFGASFFILIFVGITGLTPSMSRAAPVAFLSLLAWYLGRDRSPWRVLLAVMAGTLILSPTNLLDLAWLLSFASFTGIMVFSSLFKTFFYGAGRGGKKPGFIADLIFSSLSATLLCAPILIYFYGSISLISILANLLILPTISIVMGLTFLTGLFETIALAPLAGASASLAKIILDYHFAVVNFLGDQRYFLVSLPAGVPGIFVLYIPLAIVAAIFALIVRRRRRRLFLSLGVLTI